ncbi:MAG: hypothetical protein ACR2OA_02210 [Rubripirellula sp.]
MGLEVFSVDHFFVGTSGERVVDVQVDEMRDHPDRAIRKKEWCSSGVVTAEILKVTNNWTIGCRVRGSDDPSSSCIGVMKEAMPYRAPKRPSRSPTMNVWLNPSRISRKRWRLLP